MPKAQIQNLLTEVLIGEYHPNFRELQIVIEIQERLAHKQDVPTSLTNQLGLMALKARGAAAVRKALEKVPNPRFLHF